MKGEDIKKAYDEIKFSKNLEARYFDNIMFVQYKKQRNLKYRAIPVLICIMLLGSTVFAAAKFNWFEWEYGKDASVIQSEVDEEIYSVQNKKLKMSVESSVFTKEGGRVFVHIEALNQDGKKFMQNHADKFAPMLNLNSSVENDSYSGSGNNSGYYKELSDEENWYYWASIIYNKTNLSKNFASAKVTFGGEEVERMEVEFPIKQIVNSKLEYKECGVFRNITISPLVVTFSWNAEDLKNQEVDMIITYKDGKTLKYNRAEEGKNYKIWCLDYDRKVWEQKLMSYDEKNGECMMNLVPKEIINVGEIESVRVNGIVCE